MTVKQTLTIATAGLATVAALLSPIRAQNTVVDGVSLLKVEVGARPAGMGGAFVSIAGDPRSAVYNPAAGVSDGGFDVSVGHTEYWENVRLESGHFSHRLAPKWTLHGGIRYGVVDKLEARQTPTEDPTALFDAQDISFKGGVAYRVTDRISAGVSAGLILEKIGEYDGSAVNVDLGLLVTPTDRIAVGVSATQIGSDLTLSAPGTSGSDDVSLPTIYRVGGSYRYDRYLGAADVVVVDDEAHLHLGAEAALHEMFSLRAGYMIGYDTKNFTAGASFSRRMVTVDYAFVPYTDDLGTSHLFNLTLSL